MPVVDQSWPEHHARNRAILDTCLRLLAAWPVPYGSPVWHALPADHPDRHTSMRRAAEAWHRYWQPDAIVAREAAHADRIDRAVAERIRKSSIDLSGTAEWSRTGPTWRELHRRRYPWLHDPTWRCRHERPHGDCVDCTTGISDTRKDLAA